jgi:hypothetical protein
VVWSEILMRRYWHNAKDGKAVELARKPVNLAKCRHNIIRIIWKINGHSAQKRHEDRKYSNAPCMLLR